ncbi:MAG: thioredoxin family protein [Proteobacteria bacterium]|nr:thioredoxin family protein [Burkholderiales bacterium]MCA0311236.1 thioredoxin family protein [Pseudomonadota bacterium]TXI27007.1 MAG: thioredoxin [Ottowia sp.]
MSLPLNDPDLRALLAATLAATPTAGAVICLCANWCGTCRAFEAGFRQAALAHPGLAFRWLDVEDEADALGELDIETFPTLVIGAADGAPRFAGPVPPQPGQIGRLLHSLGW